MKLHGLEHKGIRSLIEIAKKTRHEYAPVELRDLPYLDCLFYQRAQQDLEQLGFRPLGDWENVTLRPSARGMLSFKRTCLRIAVSTDGHVMAAAYHIQPGLFIKLVFRLLGRIKDGYKVRELETEYSNGTFPGTSGTTTAVRNVPPFMLREFFPEDTSMATLFQHHRHRMSAYESLEGSPRPVLCHDAAGVHAAQDRQQALRSAYLKQRDILGEEERLELERLNSALTERIRSLAKDESG
jgi:hypothetical protein